MGFSLKKKTWELQKVHVLEGGIEDSAEQKFQRVGSAFWW